MLRKIVDSLKSTPKRSQNISSENQIQFLQKEIDRLISEKEESHVVEKSLREEIMDIRDQVSLLETVKYLDIYEHKYLMEFRKKRIWNNQWFLFIKKKPRSLL